MNIHRTTKPTTLTRRGTLLGLALAAAALAAPAQAQPAGYPQTGQA